MNFGVYFFGAEWNIDPMELGREAEARGFDFLLVPEHTHIPVSRQTPYPGGPGPLPAEFSHTPDPFVLLAAVAAVTKRLQVGTGVSLIIERHPITQAKVIASLDDLSDGRVLFGIGAGWNREEMENHGTPYDRRWRVMREHIEAMQAIWTQDEASYEGEFVKFEKIWCWPKPKQKPYPPILVGGNQEGALRRVVRFGDEWMPSNTAGIQDMAGKFNQLQELAAAAGRGPIPGGVFNCEPEAAQVEQYINMGLHRFCFMLPHTGRDDVLRKLDELKGWIDPLRG